MAWAYRTGSYANDATGWSGLASGGTQTVTLGAAVSSGDLLVLSITALASALVTPSFTISDSVNGSWSSTADHTLTINQGGQAGRFSLHSFPNSGAGTPVITVTVTNTGDTSQGGLQCAAYSGIATTTPKDVDAGGTGTTNAPASGNTANTGAANELVVGTYHDFGEGRTVTQGTGFTSRGKHDADGGNWEGMLEDKDSGSSGTAQSSSTSLDNTTIFPWGMICAVYKLSGGGPPPTPIEPPMRTLRGVGI